MAAIDERSGFRSGCALHSLRRGALGALCVLGVLGCSDTPEQLPRGTPVTTTMSAARLEELAALQGQLDSVKGLDAGGFAARYTVPFITELGYDPLAAQGLDRIRASSLALNEGEQVALGARGFVISSRTRYPSFVYGYQTIYSADLPVYISADSILFALHKSFDDVLKAVEEQSLVPALDRLLTSMRAALGSGAASDLSADARRDADVYLTVAKRLLTGDAANVPVAGGDAGTVDTLVSKALAASGAQTVRLFGRERNVDFSQLAPRGHYTDSETLQRYFRATMWLGRIDLRLIETQEDHTQLFNRRQLEGAYVLRALMNDAAIADWKRIDGTVGAFVGEPDNMTLPQLDALLDDLGLASASELGGKTDAEIAQAIVAGGYGAQRISSHIMINGLNSGTMPPSSTFLLLGQRYVLDSHVFSNVVYDRVQHGTVKRMMPNPLDVAFAALKSDQAGLLLGPELERHRYAPDLASMRILADAHPQSFWDANLYNHWLAALRTLSPMPDVANPAAVGLPRVAGTEAWGRRLLNTQLASWAELRHDTVLYAKQSYTSSAACEYPDAYVDPYPELFARIAAFAARGVEVAAGLEPAVGPRVSAWFEQLRSVASILETMAKDQRTGTPHSAEHLAFVNQMTFMQGCGTLADYDGWYAKLFFEKASATELDPTIADVHTQPTDEVGNEVGRVLHVGTGMARTMVVTVDTCSGPHAYVGLASSYYEQVTEGFERLTDEDWKKDLMLTPPAEVPWVADLVAH